MSAARRLLALSHTLCGPEATDLIVEPLLADWQREWMTTRGWRRGLVLTSGSAAYLSAVIRCGRVQRVALVSPASAFVVAAMVFTTLAAVMTWAPFWIGWRHWAPADPRLFWSDPSILRVPASVASAMTFALLPAAMLAAVTGQRRLLVGGGVLFMIALFIMVGWVVPWVENARTARFYATLGENVPPTWEMPTASALARHVIDHDPHTRRAAWWELERKIEPLAATVSLALLGWAIGRARAEARQRCDVTSLALWWLLGWISYRSLAYWSGYFNDAVSLPSAAALWMPAALLAAVAVLVVVGRGRFETERQHL